MTTEVSTHVLTHEIYYEHPLTRAIKTHYCTGDEYKKIRQCYDKKTSLDLGEGKSITWTLFKGGDRIDPQKASRLNATTYVNVSYNRRIDDHIEYEIKTIETIDKKTKEVLETETIETEICTYTPEQVARHKQFTKEIKARHSTGRTLAEIITDLFFNPKKSNE